VATENRTEPATPKRRRDAAQKGQVARSVEVNAAAALAAGFVGLLFVVPMIGRQWASLAGAIMGPWLDQDVTPEWLFGHVYPNAAKVFIGVLLLGGIVAVCSLAAQLLQGGLVFSVQALKPDLGRVNPLRGAARLFSGQAVTSLLRATLKAGGMLAMAYIVWQSREKDILGLVSQGFPLGLYTVVDVAKDLLVKMLLFLIVVAALDYSLQRWTMEKSLRMTRNEVKDEHRQSEGDPMVRTRIRQIQRAIARRRMMQKVPKAAVVVVNPTEIAVALDYHMGTNGAPTVVAKGQGDIAKKIVQIARKNGVPVVQNIPVARALFRMVEVDQSIPLAMYEAVAEILAFVFRMKAGREQEVGA